MKKSLLCCALALLFAFSLTACGKKQEKGIKIPSFQQMNNTAVSSQTPYDFTWQDLPASGTVKSMQGCLLAYKYGNPQKTTVFNTLTQAVVYEKENTETEKYSSMLYTAVETPFFAILTQTTKDGEKIYTKTFYDLSGTEFYTVDENVTPHIVLDLIYINNEVFRANADGSVVKAFSVNSLSYIPKTTSFITLYGNGKYYYGVQNPSAKTAVCVYDREFRLVYRYEFIGNANKTTVGYLNNGDLLLQYRVNARRKDEYSYGNTQVQYDVITLLLSPDKKTVREIPCNYFIDSLYSANLFDQKKRNIADITYSNFSTLAFAADISDKTVPDDTDYLLYAVDNAGNFTHNLTAALPAGAKTAYTLADNAFALIMQDNLSVMLCNSKGTILGDISRLTESNLSYLLSESEVFDLQLKPLLNYKEKKYELSHITHRALFFTDENGETVRYQDGKETVLTDVNGTGGSTVTLAYVTNSVYALKTQTGETVSYTYYNDLGAVIGTADLLYEASETARPGDVVLLYCEETEEISWKYYRCPQNPYLAE